MRIGLSFGMMSALCQRPRFTPDSLFSTGDVGLWVQPSALGTLSQDAAGTLAVTGVGQRVGRILDRSGANRHATQPASDLRPTFARVPVGGRRNRLTTTDLSKWGLQKGGTGQLPVVNTLSALSTATLPDGANEADAAKGWTSTGLALDGATLWWGNLAIRQPGGAIGQRQLIQTDLAGATILNSVAIAEQPQGVAVLGDHLYYASPTLNQIRRVNRTGGGEVVFAAVTAPNGLATDGAGFWVGSGSTVHRLNLDGTQAGSFETGLADMDHLHHDAVRGWLWITSGANGIAGFVTIWSLAEGRKLNTFRLSQALALEGLVVSGDAIIVSHDGYYHGADIADATRRQNEVQVYSGPTIFGGIWDGGLANHVLFNRGASNTSADFSQLQQGTTVGGARTGSAHVWVASGTSNIAMNLADASGNTQEVETLGTTPTRVQFYRATSGASETLQIRLRGGVTADQQLSLYLADPQVEAGATATAFQTVASDADVIETGKQDRFALLFDQLNDAMAATLPAGTYTVAHAHDAGVTITAGVVHGGGDFALPAPVRLFAAVVINRALTAAETASLTVWLTARRP